MHHPAEDTGPEDTSPEDPQVDSQKVGQSPEEILEYWTPERMAQAIPRELNLPPVDPEEEN
jgi:hypothetical protein